MDIKKFNLNYATLKRRGYDDNYTYIFTVHKYPVRRPGYDDIDLLKTANINIEYGIAATDDNVRFSASIARSRSKVLQLACNNRWDFFVTLTISPDAVVDRYDLKGCVKSLLKFFDNYKQRRASAFKYLLVPEKHKDGAYHFHGLLYGINPSDLKINEHGYLDFVPYCTRYGFCSMGKIKDTYACATYVSKYISKDMFLGAAPEAHTHLYYASRGLAFDKVISVGQALKVPDDSVASCSDSGYCIKYFCKSNIFKDYIADYTYKDLMPSLPSWRDINTFKIKLIYSFCNNHNILIDEKTNLFALYDSLREEIITDAFTEYDKLKYYYRDCKNWKITSLSADDVDKLKELFVIKAIADNIVDPDFDHKTLICDQLDIWSCIYGFK